MWKRSEFSLRNTIFIRLIATFLLIMIPIFLIGIYIYHWSIRTASDDISKSTISQISFYLSDLENEIERMKLLQYNVVEDTDLNKLAILWETMGNIERTEKINAVVNRIFTLQNSSKYINNVSVHIQAIAKSISSQTGPGTFNAVRFQEIRAEFGKPGSQLIYWDGGIYLSATKPSGVKDGEPNFVVELTLDYQQIQQELAQFNTYPGSGTLLISNRNGYVLESGQLSVLDSDMITTMQALSSIAAGHSGLVELGGQRYFVSRADSSALDLSIYRLIPEKIIYKPLDKFYTWAWLFAVGAITIIVFYAFSTYRFIHKPLLKLIKGFRRLENGDMDLAIVHGSNDEFRYIYTRFNKMVVNLRTLIDQVYKQKIMAQRAELKQLQSQINPHFLYNSFFLLHSMAQMGDVERIELFTLQLGEYFQFVTRNASDEVTLKQEIHHARMYTEIQQFRFSRRIKVQFDELPTALEEVKVPRLIVQPIIENAFEHSLEKLERDGLIIVRFEHSDHEVRIIVEDNGNRLSPQEIDRIASSLSNADEKIETTGIVNIHRRIVMTFGAGYGVHLSKGDMGGLKVMIRFPYEVVKSG